MDLEHQQNDLPASPSDFERTPQLLRGTDEDLETLRGEVAPHMTDSALRFCRDHYARRKRLPYRGELRLWDRVLSLRHKETEGIRIESMRCEDSYIAETYKDLLTKLRVKDSHRVDPPTLSDAASASGNYLHMIGRSTPYRFPLENRFRANSPFPYAAFVLLCPKDEQSDYQQSLDSLSQREELRPISLKRIPVSEYGLLATLALHAKGLIGNPDLLPLKEGETLFSALSDAYCGHELWNLSRDGASTVCALAEEHGLQCVYFARATDGEDFIMQSAERGAPRKIINLSILRELMTISYSASCLIQRENPEARDPMTEITEDLREAFSDTLPSARLFCARGEKTVTENGYSQALSLCVDLLLWLVCRGVNRRAVAFDLSYTLPKISEYESQRGEVLAPILGAYRFALELASPQPPPKMLFQGERIHLSFVAYASAPHNPIPNAGGEEGDLLYYLPVWQEGQADFAQIRAVTDQFHTLAAAGQIHSARPVSKNLSEEIHTLLDTLVLEPSENFSHSVGKRGILFTSKESLALPCLGKIHGTWVPQAVQNPVVEVNEGGPL